MAWGFVLAGGGRGGSEEYVKDRPGHCWECCEQLGES